MMPEEWRPVVGWEGFYQVSNMGRVRSLVRRRGSKTGILKGHIGTGGYRFATLKRFPESACRRVHHLVLEAFVGPMPPGMEGCHGNGNPADNRLENLRWDIRSSNMLDAVAHGTHNNSRKTHCPQGHPLSGTNLVPHLLNHYGRRSCLICARAAEARYRQRQSKARRSANAHVA